MNPIEDRIRNAADAVARTLPDGSAPPLHVATRLGRAASRRGRTVRGTRGRRLLAPLAAATAVVAVAAVSASVLSSGSPRPGSHGHKHAASSAATRKAAARRAWLARLDRGAIGEIMPATGAQYTAGALFYGEIQALESHSIAKCMARYGYHVTPITAVRAARGDYDLTQFPDLAQLARAGTFPSGAAGFVAPYGSKAFTVKLNSCQKAAQVPFVPIRAAGSRLANPFLKVELSNVVPAAVRATLPGLRACATRFGWPHQPYGSPNSVINSFPDFVDWIAGHIDGAVSRGAANTTIRSLDRHWAHVFLACAGPPVRAQFRIWTAEQRSYLRTHRAQVQAFLVLVHRIMTTAERKAGNVAP